MRWLVQRQARFHLANWRDVLLRRRLYRDMHPLWLALVREFPEICLNPPNHPERSRTFRPTGAYRRLYRRVIEIHDGVRLLTDYMNPAASQAAHDRAMAAGATSHEARTTAYAAAIALALHDRRAGMARGDPPAPMRKRHSETVEVNIDVEPDAKWLASVSLAYRDFPDRRHSP